MGKLNLVNQRYYCGDCLLAKNRYMHIDFENESANEKILKCKNGTLELSLEELAIQRMN